MESLRQWLTSGTVCGAAVVALPVLLSQQRLQAVAAAMEAMAADFPETVAMGHLPEALLVGRQL